MNKKPLISVIFPTLNSAKLLPDFFDSLKQQTYPKNKIEVIIVDNGSSDKTVQSIKKHYPNADIIRKKHNLGFAPALNIAAKKAKGRLIFITNDDATFNRTCIEELVKLLISDPSIGMVSGKLLYLKPKDTSAWPGFRLNPWLGYQPYDTSNEDQIRESDWFSGPGMMMKKEALQKAGYFDEGYFFAGEDYDLSLTIKQVGYKIMYTPKAVIHHGFRRTGKMAGENYSSIFNHFRGRFRCVLKKRSPTPNAYLFPCPIHTCTDVSPSHNRSTKHLDTLESSNQRINLEFPKPAIYS